MACPADQLLTADGNAISSVAETATDAAGNTSTPSNVVTVKIDRTAPLTTLTPGAGAVDRGLPLISVVGTASVKNQAGASVGTLPFTCFDSQGLKLGLAASDNGGSGMASLTYATTGAQPVAATTVSAASSQPGITTPGLTTLTYAARDVAGNQQATHSESIIVGHGLACASPTPALPMHAHGTLVANGTATSNGQSYPFSQTIPF